MAKEFIGWVGHDASAAKGNLKWEPYTAKTLQVDDIEMDIMYCGVCASDVMLLETAFGDNANYPIVPGHEIVGKVTQVGSQVASIQVGDHVGVGAQSDACLKCDFCLANKKNYCRGGHRPSCCSRYMRGSSDGEKTCGGFAERWRGPHQFAVKIPKGLDLADAAPMFCGGVTVFSPLKQYGAGTKAKRVGVVGIGGLGHFAILFAKAMGADVTAISHSAHKAADARALGASHFLETGQDPAKACESHKQSLDLIVCTANGSQLPFEAYLSLLAPGGHLVLVGVPEGGLPSLNAFSLISGNVNIGGSVIGDPVDIADMLQFVAAKGIKPWITKYRMSDANEVLPAMKAGKAHYRYVLVNEGNGGVL